MPGQLIGDWKQSNESMFILSFLSLVWTMWYFSALVVGYVGTWWRYAFVLHSAHIVVLNNLHSNTGICMVDVTREMRKFPHLHRKTPVLSRLLSLATNDELRNALASHKAAARIGSDPRIRKAPLCYLDIRYTQCPLRHIGNNASPLYRYLYPIYAVTDKMQYPPKCTLAVRSAALQDAFPVALATLTVRYDGESTRHLSCNVTDRIKGLEGPLGDFHRPSRSGYQLRKQILRVVLVSDILALKGSLRDDMPSSSGSSSSDSLKSMVPQNPPLSIRLQFQQPHQRVEVVKLDSLVL